MQVPSEVDLISSATALLPAESKEIKVKQVQGAPQAQAPPGVQTVHDEKNPPPKQEQSFFRRYVSRGSRCPSCSTSHRQLLRTCAVVHHRPCGHLHDVRRARPRRASSARRSGTSRRRGRRPRRGIEETQVMGGAVDGCWPIRGQLALEAQQAWTRCPIAVRQRRGVVKRAP